MRPPVKPFGELAILAARAEDTRRHTAALVIHATLAHVAHRVYSAFPTQTAALVIVHDPHTYASNTVWLDSIITTDDVPLWTRNDKVSDDLRSFRTETGATWSDVVDRIEADLLEMMAGHDPSRVWTREGDHDYVFRCPLPTAEQVADILRARTPMLTAEHAHAFNATAGYQSPLGGRPTITNAGVTLSLHADPDTGRLHARIDDHAADTATLLPGTTRAALQVTVNDRQLYDAAEDQAAATHRTRLDRLAAELTDSEARHGDGQPGWPATGDASESTT